MSGKALRPKGYLDYVRAEKKLTYSVLNVVPLLYQESSHSLLPPSTTHKTLA